MSRRTTRDSFDRFGDDLTELLISYLPLDLKITYECVCKQWRRLVFRRQTHFHLLRHRYKCQKWSQLFIRSYVHQNQTFELNLVLFELLAKKLTHLTDLLIDSNCKCDENVLNILSDLYENNFKTIKTLDIKMKEDIDDEVLNRFCSLFGKTLTTVSISGLSVDKLANALSCFGQNLRSIDLKQNLKSLLNADNKRNTADVCHNKLDTILVMNPSSEDLNQFVERYGKQITHLSLSFDQNYKYNINDSLKYVANLANLRCLRLDSELFFVKQNNFNEQHMIDDSLELIGQKCHRLDYVDICIFGDLISNNLLRVFGQHFDCLERLDLSLWDIGDKYFPTVNAFGFNGDNGKHLTKLNLMFEQLSDDHLKDIHLFLPNLRAVKLNSDEHLTDQCLKYLSKLKQLHTIVLEGNIDINYLTIDGIIEFVRTCCQTIRIIDIEFGNDLNEIDFLSTCQTHP